MKDDSDILHFFLFVFELIETRYRAVDRLLRNLRGEDAIEEADALGFNFPTSTSEQIRDALQAICELDQDDDQQLETEIITEWNEDLNEFQWQEESVDDSLGTNFFLLSL